MREIRFRGKRLDNGEWVYGWYGHKEATDQHFIMIERLHDAPEYGSYFMDVEVDPETVGQYTGLRDKNGREIYEGDILRHTVDYGPGGEWERVTAIQLTPFGINVQPWIFCEEGYLPEIIGNIYENPELLKGAEA